MHPTNLLDMMDNPYSEDWQLAAPTAATDLAKSYLVNIRREIETGNATEHTYRAALKGLVQSLRSDIIAINEPKRVSCGAPDFVVKKDDLIIGHIEAKDVGKSLDEAENSEQLERYFKSLDNLILTDYLEFRWYLKGLPRETARLARLTKDGKIVLDKNGMDGVVALLENFLNQPVEPISSSNELSQRLAHLAHSIRDVIVEAFNTEKATNQLWNLRKAFASVLIPDMDQPQKTAEFADMYAQTIVYGLFADVTTTAPNPSKDSVLPEKSLKQIPSYVSSSRLLPEPLLMMSPMFIMWTTSSKFLPTPISRKF